MTAAQGAGRWSSPDRQVGQSLTRVLAFGSLIVLAGCATEPSRTASNGRVWDPKLGVWSSPRLVAEGDSVPRGGGSFLTGRPYVIGGRTYVPRQDANGYAVVGVASWYGDAFHGRRTANGEIFDKRSVSAAHPTLPLPSYVRVTNLKNNRSMVVRVNDRGPYHGGRVMDVSQRVAEALEFRGEGTARIKVEYLGRASLQGSDDGQLMASLRTDGAPAQLAGLESEGQGSPAPVADARDRDPRPAPPNEPAVASVSDPGRRPDEEAVSPAAASLVDVPIPPERPFILDNGAPGLPDRRQRQRGRMASGSLTLASYAEGEHAAAAVSKAPPLQ